MYPDCGRQNQSPIDINTTLVKLDPSLPQFDLHDLSRAENVTMTLENVHGHTVEVHLSGQHVEVTGGGLPGTYILDQFHFHWGDTSARGSEHTIDGLHYPMEMHMVMYSSQYPDIHSAMTETQGLAVLGFLFQVGADNPNFEPLLEHFHRVHYSDDTDEIPTFAMNTLLPNNTNLFYRYPGSLTTPPCYETVIWSIFCETIEVSEDQMEKFRSLLTTRKGEEAQVIADDFRPTQPLNDRVVSSNDGNAA